jgi:hypothetical protein
MSWAKHLVLLLWMCAVFAFGFLAGPSWHSRPESLVAFLNKNFVAVVWVPVAYVAALGLISIFADSESPSEFQGFGFRLRGAAADTMLWILCFAIILFAIGIFWKN